LYQIDNQLHTVKITNNKIIKGSLNELVCVDFYNNPNFTKHTNIISPRSRNVKEINTENVELDIYQGTESFLKYSDNAKKSFVAIFSPDETEFDYAIKKVNDLAKNNNYTQMQNNEFKDFGDKYPAIGLWK